MQSKVSMVMPCYNKKDGIGPMLESVYNQIWDNVELILVNDGSTDGTREIIAEWEPKLRRRGYEVVIIDQENAGTADAVKNGLSLISGEFVCCVDCDDWLHPEYVSKMAAFLHGNPEYDIVACDYELLWKTAEGDIVDITMEVLELPSSKFWLESLLLRKADLAVWKLLVRTECLKSCRVVENFFVRADLEKLDFENASISEKVFITQEPSFLIPLAAGGGRVFCLKDRLYTANLFGSEYTSFRRKNSSSYTFARNCATQYAVNSLNLSQSERKRINLIAELSLINQRFMQVVVFDRMGEHEKACAIDAADCANRIFVPCPEISCEQILKTGYRTFFQAIWNTILGYKKAMPDLRPKARVIGIGACGSISKELIPALMGTELECDMLWDSNAKDGDCQSGVKITRPEFEKLLPNDVIVILSRRRTLHEFVRDNLPENGLVTCLTFYETLDFLAAHYYGKLYDCRLAID